ncbi:MAG: DMT family transporter [candidate division Zixibacteria bacterium]|nr:DMT family transporter [candidate division Zixibacteria bacterium]
MKTSDILILILLGAIWGGSFIFMRVISPVLGPLVTTELRVLIGGLALVGYFRIIKFDMQFRRYWKHYLFIGAINSATPFFMYSFAALHIPASYSAILNSSAPLWSAILSVFWLGEKLTLLRSLGLLIGASGVFLVANVPPPEVDSGFLLAVLACLLATLCYGFAAVWIKRFGKMLKPMGIAGATQLMAALVLLPAVPAYPIRGEVSSVIILNLLGLAIICSAVAYLFYFKLIADIGPTKALTVTFLMPLFGIIWGMLFLGEQITAPMLAGMALILLGTGLVLNIIRLPRKTT